VGVAGGREVTVAALRWESLLLGIAFSTTALASGAPVTGCGWENTAFTGTAGKYKQVQDDVFVTMGGSYDSNPNAVDDSVSFSLLLWLRGGGSDQPATLVQGFLEFWATFETGPQAEVVDGEFHLTAMPSTNRLLLSGEFRSTVRREPSDGACFLDVAFQEVLLGPNRHLEDLIDRPLLMRLPELGAWRKRMNYDAHK